MKHIRSTHYLTYSGDIKCGQQNCSRIFQNLDAFRKHLVRIHSPRRENVAEPCFRSSASCDHHEIEGLFQNIKKLLEMYIFSKVDTDSIKKFEKILKFMESPFDEFKTEFKLMSYLEKNNLYIKPKEFTVDSSNLTDNDSVTNSKIVIPDVKFNFTKCLETNNMLDRIIEYMDELDNETDSGILTTLSMVAFGKKRKILWASW